MKMPLLFQALPITQPVSLGQAFKHMDSVEKKENWRKKNE